MMTPRAKWASIMLDSTPMLTIGRPMATTPLTKPPNRTAKAMIANRKGSCPNIPRF